VGYFFGAPGIFVLLHGLEVCALNKTEIALLDFVINRFFVKLFQTNDIKL